MKMALPSVNYSTWQHILCSKVEAGEDIKNSGVIVCSRLHSGPSSFLWPDSPPVIPADTCALSHLAHQSQIEIKSKNKVIRR